jgi:hypothetical protein
LSTPSFKKNFYYPIMRLFSDKAAVKLIGKIVRIFMRYGMVGMLAQTNPALCCATPLGLMVWWMGTQGRRSCLAPTLGFVVERRWRSMPAGTGIDTISTAIAASGATRTGVTNAKGVRTAKRLPAAWFGEPAVAGTRQDAASAFRRSDYFFSRAFRHASTPAAGMNFIAAEFMQ